MLRAATTLPMQFDGFIEGDKLASGETDVIVTEGFAGYIALKTAEGTARFVPDYPKRSSTSPLRSKAGFLLSRPALHLLQVQFDPNNPNVLLFLCTYGGVVKNH